MGMKGKLLITSSDKWQESRRGLVVEVLNELITMNPPYHYVELKWPWGVEGFRPYHSELYTLHEISIVNQILEKYEGSIRH
jgi:hypothetical protein